MDVKRLSFFQQFFSSISGSYRELAQQTFSKALGYLLIVGLLLGCVHAVKFFLENQHETRVEVQKFVKNSPEFRFANGQLSVDAKMPIVTNTGSMVVIVDTSDEPNEGLLDRYEEGYMLEKDRLIRKSNRFTKQEYLFSEVKELSFTKKDVLGLTPWYDAFFGVLAFLGIIWFIFSKLFSALCLSLVGLIINTAHQTRLSYNNILAICVYALTFPMILLTVKIFVPGGIPFFAVFYFALAVVYVWIGVRASGANHTESENSIPPMDTTLSE